MGNCDLDSNTQFELSVVSMCVFLHRPACGYSTGPAGERTLAAAFEWSTRYCRPLRESNNRMNVGVEHRTKKHYESRVI